MGIYGLRMGMLMEDQFKREHDNQPSNFWGSRQILMTVYVREGRYVYIYITQYTHMPTQLFLQTEYFCEKV